ncbi:MAG: AgmX/PglI C-terminal domain-containing protein [Deltaproteobacteria bacterium]|nr:AgmX/PglI C-terminal domain-containing protein [Deltaproteobacteria bacterium]
MSIGQPNAQGDLDKAIIRRYIKRNIQKIQYCYEKELLAKANLTGTVQTQFFIGPDGSVKSASGSGMDPTVANCVASVIKGIEFPKPKGGGGVQVNYPFTFRPADNSTTTPVPPAVPSTTPPADPPRPAAVRAGGKLAENPTRYTPGAANPLLAQRDALEECFRTNPKPYGAVAVKLDWTGTTVTAAEVHGVVSEDVAKCVVEAAKKVMRTSGTATSQTCSVAFGDMPPADLPSVEITAEAIKLDGVPVADPKATGDFKYKIEPLYAKIEGKVLRDRETTAPVSIIGPLVIRPIDTTPIAIVNKVLSTILMAGGDYVLAASDGPSWRVIDLVAVPVPPVPRGTGGRWSTWRQPGLGRRDGEHVTLSILMLKDRMWLGLSRVNEFQEVPLVASKEHDYDKLESTLKDHKKSVFFADRADLEIAGEGVTWIDVVRAIEIARKVGFVDYTLTDPEGLAARPQL